MTTKDILEQLREIAKFSNTGLTFKKEGRQWIALWPNGRQAWCGSLAEVRRVAGGKEANP